MKPNPKDFRVDAAEKIRGQTRYIRDEKLADLWYAGTVRSPFAHARIVKIDFDPEFDWDQVTVVTAEDVPNNEVAMLENDMLFLAMDEVRYVGEPVVLIAAPSQDLANSALNHVQVHYQPLSHVLDVLASESSEVKIFGDNNIFKEIVIEKGDLAAAKRQAEHVVSIEVRTGFQEHLYLEPQGIIAIPEDQRVTIRGSMQCPFYIKTAVENMFNNEKQITVIHVPTGGAFGGKEDYPSLIAGHAALLAVKSGMPVAVFFNREEDVQFTTKRHPSYHRDTAYVDQQGKILGLDLTIYLDGGAYCTLSPVVLSRAALTATNCYHVPSIRIHAKAVATNTSPSGAFRGFGGPQAVFAMEMLIEKIALKLNLPTVQVRKQNLIRPGQHTPTGQVLTESVSAHETFDDVVQQSQYAHKYEIYRKQNRPILERLRRGQFPKAHSSDRLLGIGISSSVHGAGFTGTGENVIKGKIRVEIEKDGMVVIYSAQTEMGQGLQTAFRKILAESLQIDISEVKLGDVNTDNVPNSGPTVASRSTMVIGSLLTDAAQEIINRLKAQLKQSYGVEFEYRDGIFHGGGTKTIPFCKAAAEYAPLVVEKKYQHPPHIQFDDKLWKGDAYPVYSWAAAVAEVEVDPVTFEIKVTRYYTTHEIGKAINYDQAVAQIQGGSLQGIGYAIYEKVGLQDGKFDVTGFSDYIIPTSTEMPEFEVNILENLYSFGPFGAKGLGELPMVGAAPAVVSALWMIFGKEFNQIPVLPENLIEIYK
ncbi:MAG: xanthine dehydrogenase family protein molybdopterin-binding subunit [bacterium]|nr:xanthine dehydrogenase family protein molybdopterin-binding subunit [bacterium]